MTVTYTGLNAQTGLAITDTDHLQQSVADIIGTPIGSVITLREYGTYNMQMIDQPMTKALRLQLIAATVMALLRWEPRARPAKVSLDMGEQSSQWEFSLTMVRTEGPLAGKAVALSVPYARTRT